MVIVKKKEFNESMLDFLCCPICHGDFTYDKIQSKLVCVSCKQDFVIKDSIPILIPK